MAASTNRDVTLTVQAETIGENSIREMADQVRALAKTGGDAAPQFEALARELDRVADSQRAIQTLQDLDAAMEQTSRSVVEAAGSYDAAAVKVREQAEALEVLKTAQTVANDTLKAAVATQIGAREAYALTRAEIKGHSEVTDADRQATSQAAAEQAKATAEVGRARQALAALKPEVAAASAELDKLQKSANFANRELSNVKSVADTQAAAYATATAGAQALGVETDALVGEQARLLDAQNTIVESTQRLQNAQVAQARSQALLAQEAVALQQAQIALEAEIRADEAATLKAAAATAKDAQEKAEAAEAYRLYLRSVEEVTAALYDQAEARKAADAVEVAAKAREDAEATLADAAAHEKFAAASRELDAVLLAEAQALAALAEAKAEQTESDRLAIIQINSAFEARQRGVVALHAEVVAISEVAAADAELATAQAAAAAATRALAEAATAAQGALSGAFSDVGVRSLQEIQAEVGGVERSLAVLRANFEAGAISSQDMARAVGAATVQLERLRAEAASIPDIDGTFKRISASINGVISDFGALGAAVATIGFAIKPILDANIQLENTRRILTEIYGSVGAANAQIATLQASADKSGIAISSLTGSFTQFAASAHSAGLSTQLVQNVFQATIGAAGQLGLSGERVTLVLEALGQMASKGVVSMEELRRQLGNSLPGALAELAKGLGISVAQLDKMVSSGQLLASDALPALANALLKIGDQTKPVDGLQQSFARLENQVTLLFQKFSTTTAYSVLNAAVSGAAKNFDTLITAVTALGELYAVNKVGSYIADQVRLQASLASTTTATTATTTAVAAGTVAEAENTAAQRTNAVAREANVAAINAQTAATVTNAAATEAAGVAAAAAGTRLGGALSTGVSAASTAFGALGTAARGAVNLIGGFPAAAALVVLNARSIGTSIAETVFSFTSLGKELKANEARLLEQDEAQKRAVGSQQELSTSVVGLVARYNDLTAPLQKSIVASEKRLEAAKLEAQANDNLADLTGNLTNRVNAQADGALKQATAGNAVVENLRAQANATSDLVVALQNSVVGEGKVDAATQKRIDTTQALLVVQQANVDKAQAEADVLATQAAKADLARQAHTDLSGSLVELQAQAEGYRLKSEALNAIQSTDVDIVRQQISAKRAYADALGLVNIALQSQVNNANLANQAVKSSASVATAATNASIAFYQAEKQQALAVGDTARARQADIAIQREQITVVEQQIRVKNSQIEADKAALAQLLAKANPADLDYQQELAAIEALKAKIAVEAAETAGLRSNIDGLNAQTQALERNTAAQKGNSGPNVIGLGGQKVAEDTIAKNGPQVVDNTGFSSLQSKINSGTISSSDVATLQATIAALKQNQQSNFNGNLDNPGLISQDAINSVNAQLLTLQTALDRLTGPSLAVGGSNGGALFNTGNSTTAPSTDGKASPSSASTSHTVTVNLNGVPTTISAASASDATALAALVQQLSAAATRAQP